MTALLLDCDGVLAETERDGHLPAFNRAFAELGLDIRWTADEYAEKLAVAGGKERIATSLTRDLLAAHALPAGRRELVEQLHARKNRIFEAIIAREGLRARPGVARIIRAADAAGWRLGIASTSAESSVRAVVEHALGPALAGRLAIFAGDVVAAKKPDSAIYELAVERLEARKADTVVIEDSRNGLLAADAAGLPCVITVSEFTAADAFTEARLVLSSLGDPGTPMTVIANRTAASPREYVTLEDLAAVLAQPEPTPRR